MFPVCNSHPPSTKVIAGLIGSHLFLRFLALHRIVIVTLSQLVKEKISLLKELMNDKNKPEVIWTYQIQVDAISSIDDYDIENIESIINQKKDLLKKSKDIQETGTLLAEIDVLEWLQAQIVVMTLGIGSSNNNGPATALGS